MPDRSSPTPDEAQLDELAKITPADVDRAQRRWRKDAPARLKDLLDAPGTPAADEPPAPSGG